MTISAPTAKLMSRLQRKTFISKRSKGCGHAQWQQAGISASGLCACATGWANSQSIREIHLSGRKIEDVVQSTRSVKYQLREYLFRDESTVFRTGCLDVEEVGSSMRQGGVRKKSRPTLFDSPLCKRQTTFGFRSSPHTVNNGEMGNRPEALHPALPRTPEDL